MKIGKYELKSVETGRFALDGGSMFGIIPRPIWERSNPPDEKNRITLAARTLILVSENRKILIDTGMGDKWDEKGKGIYKYEYKSNLLFDGLTSLGCPPDSITDVLLTHLHFDHTGGSTILHQGKLQPAFPNAKYHVQRKNFEWAMNPTERDRGSYLKENFEPLLKEGLLNLIEEEQEQFDDEIYLKIFNGHTFAQQLPFLSDGTNSVFFSGDLFPTSSHIPLPYIMGYDLQPLVTLAEKKIILKQSVEQNWNLFFAHDPFHSLAMVAQTERRYSAGKLLEL